MRRVPESRGWVGLRSSFIIGLASVGVLCAIDVQAQTIINGTKVQFDSPDQNTILPTGDPAITDYMLEVWPSTSVAAGAPVGTVDLGKPAASSGSTTILADASQFFLGLPAGQEYVATVRAIGPAGESRSAGSNPFIHLYGPTPTSAPVVTGSTNEIVLYAADFQAADIHGRWQMVSTTGTAAGMVLNNPDQSDPKVPTALASPANYVEITFNAAAGVPYHLWMRMRAANNYYGNDSLSVQFSDTIDANNSAIYRVGTSDGAPVILEEGTGAGLSGWGWNDQAYGSIADPIYFATSGPHVMRIQQREDGVMFDQIVMSAGTYLSKSPGTLKNDTTIVPK